MCHMSITLFAVPAVCDDDTGILYSFLLCQRTTLPVYNVDKFSSGINKVHLILQCWLDLYLHLYE